MSGSVISTTGGSLVIRSDAGGETTFGLDASSIRPAELAPGDRVTVEYHVLQEGGYHASRVTLADAGAPASPTAATVDPVIPTTTGDAESLPRTAGPLPLLVLIGVLSIATAVGFRALRSRQRPRF